MSIAPVNPAPLLGMSRGRPSLWAVHGALILAQIMFGGGSVVGKLGVESFNPLLFALIRECIAGPLLLLMALSHDGKLRPKQGKDWGLVIIMGLCIFTNQAFMIIGVKLAGAIISSAWQCSQPIFTLVISLSLGWESATWKKILGILLSFAGGAFLVCYGQSLGSPAAIGNVLLALNCLGTSLYVIFSKIALERYPPLTVTAWAYLSASLMMAVVAISLNNQCAFIEFVCPASGDNHDFTCGEYVTSCEPWAVPISAVLPLTYWVLFNSIGSYCLITWANRYARAGYVLAYTALQPFTSTVLSVILIMLGVKGLQMPGWNALGCIGILLGLFLLVLDGKHQHEVDEEVQGFTATDANDARSPQNAIGART